MVLPFRTGFLVRQDDELIIIVDGICNFLADAIEFCFVIQWLVDRNCCINDSSLISNKNDFDVVDFRNQLQ